MAISINTTRAQIGMQIEKPQMNINVRKPQIQIDSEISKLEVKTKLPAVKIDQSKAMAELGSKNDKELTSNYAQLGKKAIQEAIAKYISEGDRMAKSQQKNAKEIADIARENFDNKDHKEFKVGLTPKSKVEFKVEGDIQINYKKGKMDIKANLGDVSMNYKRGKVNIYMKQKNTIDIRFVDQKA